jgi:hypothetical protein
MSAAARGLRVLGFALAAGLALGGCNGGPDSKDASSGDTPSSFEPVQEESEVAQTAGPLTGRQMPPSQAIGSGWAERADPGSDDEGETDPDAPSTQQRDVDELMDGLVPIGCPDAAVNIELPRPQYALERTYAGPEDEPGVALVLQFGDAKGSHGFLSALERQVRACPPAKRSPNDPVSLQFTDIARSAAQLSAVRQEQGEDADPNRYLLIAVRDGDRVGLMFLASVPATRATAIGADFLKAISRA